MTKNARFKKEYRIVVEGVTTNGFSERVFDSVLRATVIAMNEQRKQVNVTLEEV